MSTSQERWPNATSEHVRKAKEILLAVIASTGRPLPGGVTGNLVNGLGPYDLLDLAKLVADSDTSTPGLHGVLQKARTPPAD